MATSASTHAQLIQASWARCREFGLQPQSAPDFDCLTHGELSALLERRQALLQLTRDTVLPQYAHLLGNASYLVMLADASGCLLDTWGSRRFIDPQYQHGFSAGAHWHERGVGTNALGTALACAQPIHVGQDEHFLRQNRYMASAAAPLFDAQRQRVGVLDVASDGYLPASQTLGLVRMMSQSLENRLILAQHADQHAQLLFNSASDNLDSPWAGLLIFDERGQVLAANHRADSLLGGNPLRQNLEQLFQMPMRQLLAHAQQQPFALQAAGRNRFHCQWQAPRQSPTRPAPRAGDPRLDKALTQASLLLEKDIPVLVQGETGAGKEVFARQLHERSARRAGPFVAVNCAAIPENLIESELFGYVAGAFTGASSKGMPGLLVQADGGTLFLDEIGDMPLALQTRLLRVMAEGEVAPLGGAKTRTVDIQVICASHRDLAVLVSDGRFREDLYFRLGCARFCLPPLRERSDKLALINRLVEQQARGSGVAVGIGQAALERLLGYAWPGNVRQLHHVLAYACAVCEGGTIQLADLPVEVRGEQVEALVEHSVSPERQVVLDALIRHRWKPLPTAQALGISRATLYRRVNQLGIDMPGKH